MKKVELIKMLNRDMKEEHAAIIRYLVHGWLEGEDTSIGASLISRSREEMWHMHWLGYIICKLGGEPDFKPAPYPYDPTNRATIFRSYVAYEERLIPHYNGEADRVSDPHIKRVLQREAWESAIHARKFQRILGKLTPEEARGAPGGTPELPKEFLEKLKYLFEKKELSVELKDDGIKRMVLRRNYGDKIESEFCLTRQGVRWRFHRLFSEIYIDSYLNIFWIESL